MEQQGISNNTDSKAIADEEDKKVNEAKVMDLDEEEDSDGIVCRKRRKVRALESESEWWYTPRHI